MVRLPVFLAAGVTSACPPHPATSQGVLATENDWVHALERRDATALSCILAPEFTDTSWRGELVSRDAVLERLSSRPPSTLKLSDLSVFRDRRVAVVRGVNTQSGTDSRSSGSVRFTDVFVYRGGGWRAISAHETLIGR